jgi:outer membrane protein TolC
MKRVGRSAFAILLWGSTVLAADQAVPPLDVDALLAEADASNPRLLALASRREATVPMVSQAEAAPDPLVSVSYTNESLSDFTLGSSPDSNLTFTWIQEVLYPGKRRLAGTVARAEGEVAAAEVARARLEVRSGVLSAYAELYRLDRRLEILAESRKLMASFLDAARARYENGQGVLENVLKAQAELARIDAEIIVSEQDRRGAASGLGALLGRESGSVDGRAVRLPPMTRPEAAAVEREVVDGSPDLALRRAEALRGESRLDLARRNLKPDLMWSAAYANRGGLDPMVTGMFGVRLPLYRSRKQAAAVVQAQHELDAARKVVDSQRIGVLAEARDLLARAEKAESLARLYREGIVPQEQSAVDAAAAAYASARIEFITLLDDFRGLLEDEIDLESQRAELMKTLAALELLTGERCVAAGRTP